MKRGLRGVKEFRFVKRPGYKNRGKVKSVLVGTIGALFSISATLVAQPGPALRFDPPFADTAVERAFVEYTKAMQKLSRQTLSNREIDSLYRGLMEARRVFVSSVAGLVQARDGVVSRPCRLQLDGGSYDPECWLTLKAEIKYPPIVLEKDRLTGVNFHLRGVDCTKEKTRTSTVLRCDVQGGPVVFYDDEAVQFSAPAGPETTWNFWPKNFWAFDGTPNVNVYGVADLWWLNNTTAIARNTSLRDSLTARLRRSPRRFERAGDGTDDSDLPNVPSKAVPSVEVSTAVVGLSHRREPEEQAHFDFQVEKPAAIIPGYGSPVYPDSLLASGFEGQVLAQFVVDTTGRVERDSFKIIRSDHDLFTLSVRRALADMRFVPAEVGGRKVRQLVQTPFVFNRRR